MKILGLGTPEGKELFVLPDLGNETIKIDSDESLSDEEKLKKKDELYHVYSERMDRIHTINQLLKAYSFI